MNRGIAIVFPLLLLVFSSCTLLKKNPSKKNIAADSAMVIPTTTELHNYAIGNPSLTEGTDATVNSSPAKAALIDMLTPIWQKHMDFRTFKGKAKMHYKSSGQNIDFTANIRMAKDSIIWVHITAGMGIVNVARVFITPDSFQMVNYLDKSCIRKSIDDIEELLPTAVDFQLLQHFIVGEALTEPYQQITDAADAGATWELNVDGTADRQLLAYNKSDSTLNRVQVMSNSGGFAGLISYSDYSLINSRIFATSRTVNINNNNELHDLDMDFNNASFDERINFPFSIPESYSLNK